VAARRKVSFWARKAASAAVAYLFAVQLILAAAVSAQMMTPASGGSEICHEVLVDASAPSAPSKSSGIHGAICAVCAFASHAPPLPPSAPFTVERRAFAVRAHSPVDAAATIARLRDPRTSQGPPSNA